MGLRSIFGLRDSRERIERAVLLEYEKCADARRSRLRSYRNTAILELLWVIPDLELLMDLHSPAFTGVSREAGLFIDGRFIDNVYPKLPLVLSSESYQERAAAAAQFREREAHFNKGDYEKAGCDEHDTMLEYFEVAELQRGYKFRKYPLDFLGSLTLKKNGSTLAATSHEAPAQKSDFTLALQKHVLGDGSVGGQDVTCVTVEVGYLPNPCSYGVVSVDMFFHDILPGATILASSEKRGVVEAIDSFVSVAHAYASITPSHMADDDPTL